jgi:hypothetical protein
VGFSVSTHREKAMIISEGQNLQPSKTGSIEECADLKTEINALEYEIKETIDQIAHATGAWLRRLRLQLADMCAAYEIGIADAEICLNVRMREEEKDIGKKVIYPENPKTRTRARKSTAAAELKEQIRLM